MSAIYCHPSTPLESARTLLRLRYTKDGERLLVHHRGDFRGWDGAAWPALEDDDIRAEVYEFLERAEIPGKDGAKPFNPTRPKVANVIDALAAAANLPASVEPPCWLNGHNGPPPDELLACRNGLLHIPSGALYDPGPGFFNLNAVDYDYEPDAPEPVGWFAFLDSVWGADEASIATLQEIMGYLVSTDTRLQKIFLLVGPRRSGKGTVERLLRALVGADNFCTPTLASLAGDFGLQPLIGKQVAVISDARLSGRIDQAQVAERLLSISGEDNPTVHRKFKTAWNGKIGVRFWLMANELPAVRDAAGAFASRFIVLRMTESFFGREDHSLDRRLHAERAAILNWCLEGWARLQERGQFVQPESGAADLAELYALSQPIAAFVEDKCILGPEHETPRKELYALYKEWCHDYGHVPMSDAMFGRDLKNTIPTIRDVRPRAGEGSRVRCYGGIGRRLWES